MLLKDLGEDRLISHLSGRFCALKTGLIKAIGDDTSVTTHKPGHVILATTDSLIQGTHFDMRWAEPILLGRKALAISLSDIAAMGGKPLFFLVSIALKPNTPKKFIDGLYTGLSASAKEHGVALAGGNTAKAGVNMLSTALFGSAKKNEVVYRSGGRPGDIIYVTGTLGDSALGLKALKKRGRSAMKGPFKKAVMKHLDPTPRVKEGQALARKKLATAMMDISDGLLLDLKRLCKESGAGAEIFTDKLPLSTEFKTYLAKKPDNISLALSGGEDYELLFTSPESKARDLARLSKSLGVQFSAIGVLTNRKGNIRTFNAFGKRIKFKKSGFEHF